MPFARTAIPTPAALAKRVRRLAAEQKLSAHRVRTRGGTWLIVDPATGYAHGGPDLTAQAAIELLERRSGRSATWKKIKILARKHGLVAHSCGGQWLITDSDRGAETVTKEPDDAAALAFLQTFRRPS